MSTIKCPECGYLNLRHAELETSFDMVRICESCDLHIHYDARTGEVTGTIKNVKQEQDPTGKNPHEPGAKCDAGKLRAGLVLNGFSRALLAVAAVGTFGANKYTPNGWMQVPNGDERYTDALYRHMLKNTVEDVDPDSGLLHLAHAAWNSLAVLEIAIKEKESAQVKL